MDRHVVFDWIGSQNSFVDQPNILELGHIVIGRYGGNSSSGQYKNEDGCFVLADLEQDWEFMILLDAHNTAASAELIVRNFNQRKKDIEEALARTPNLAFQEVHALVINLFQSQDFLEECRNVQGETACLIVARKSKYCWWFSVGDCLLYLHHPELASLGQYQLNQRHFYEWIGQVNTFDLPIPCYSSGIRELRKGLNHLFMTTDGLVECPGEPYLEPKAIFEEFNVEANTAAVRTLLSKIQAHQVRDSTTIVSWMVEVEEEASEPSDM
ncbi:protein phosphatase 2C domain-containing protein [Mesobacillus subterraneus]|uniref:Protein phosphatase 2C domain-containing protein n=1 Tax=Mesobacillus subterraneus TaxID=285983 RepID=A0A427TQI7_9BACI|nr:protein phosphatase 2C domain-containing protein [Mesobacillus subterraneus]RSD26659.1 protein phosphatase 2C domain-containing protein [Mesobacillus subterraneus]